MISATGIVKSFGGRQVLSGIDLNIKEGQIFGLLGPSGAGKTTLIRILTGQISCDGGAVTVGHDRRRIGIMMDDHGSYERLSCRDNLKIFADIYGVSRSRIDPALAGVGLADAGKTPAGKLSKGMAARLKLARVFMISPEVLFLDEPTSGLDPLTMRYIHKLILDRKDQGTTIFLTTHNMEEASFLCDEVALLNEGRIVERGSPAEICRRYNHQKQISLHLTTGEDLMLPHDKGSSEKIKELLDNSLVETIHSSEPTLESVFVELTGRKLEDEEAINA